MTPHVKKIVKWTLVTVVALWMIPFMVGLVHLMRQEDPTPQGAFPLRERWQIKLDSEVVAEPSAGNGKVVIQTHQNAYALDVRTGSIAWETALPSGIRPAPALIADDSAVIGYQDGVTALDVGTGRVVWEAPNTNCGGANIVPAALNQKMIYVVRYHCAVTAYDRATGAVIWEAALPGTRPSADLFLDQDRIYLVVSGAVLQVLDATTGTLLEESQGQIDGGAAYQSGVLYGLNSTYDRLVAFDVHTMKTSWIGPSVKIAFPTGSPLAIERRVLVPTHFGYPIAIDAQTGALLWAAKIGEDVYQTPTVLGDTVYMLGIGSGNVYALSIQDGSELGRLRTGEKFVITGYSYNWRPVVVDGLLIVPVRDKVYAYGD